MGTKEVMATAPLVVLLYDRTFLSGSFRRALEERFWLYLFLATTWPVVGGGLVATRGQNGSVGFGIEGFSSWSYLRTQPGVLVHYLRQVFWPTGLCLDYGWPAANSFGQIVLPGLSIVGLLGLTGWALVKRPALGFLGAVFFLVLAPTSSFVPLKDAAFEHRMYLPLAAVVVLLVIGGYAMFDLFQPRPVAAENRGRGAAWFSLALSLPIAALEPAGTVGLGHGPRSSEIASTARKSASGRMRSAAIRIIAGAITTWRLPSTVNNEPMRRSNNIKRRSDWIRTPDRRGSTIWETIYSGNKKLAEAKVHFLAALAIEPNYVNALVGYGNVLRAEGNSKQAIVQYEKALRINPRDEAAQFNLRAVRDAMPNDLDAHFRLGAQLYARGQVREAIGEWREAIRLQPDPNLQIPMLSRLAWTLATNPDDSVRDGPQGIELAERALRLSGNRDPVAGSALAAAYAETGQFSTALKVAGRALDLAMKQGNSRVERAIRVQIGYYQRNAPYREVLGPSAH